MLTIYLCDDDATILEKYKKVLEDIGKRHEITLQLKLFHSGESLLFYMDDRKERVDIIYLDIMMGEENGIKVAKKLREMDCRAEIIFLTANQEYVFESFDVSPLHYIIKGSISHERFEEIFFRAAIRAEKKADEIFTCTNGALKKHIPIREILYFEVSNRIITVHYGAEKCSFYMKMEELEKEMKPRNFIRIHRSYLIRLAAIIEIRKDSVTLVSKEVLPLGITYAKTVKTALNTYLSLAEE